VLIVDDDLMFRRVLCRAIQNDGFSVISAASATEALEMIERSLPRLVLVDLRMPDMNGMHLLRILRANPATATIPVATFTAAVTDEVLREASALGVVAVLEKVKFSLAEFRDLVRAQLAMQKAPAA